MKKEPIDNKKSAKINDDFIKQCSKIFAHDLLRYSEHGGDMENITAVKVYKFLEELDKKEK